MEKLVKKGLLSLLFLAISVVVPAQLLHQQRIVNDFNAIDVDGGFTIHLIQGDDEKVIIETSVADVFNTIDVTNNRGTLTIRSTGLDTNIAYKVALYIYFKNVDDIMAKLRAGSIDCYTQLNLDRFNLTVNGAMMVKMYFTCSDMQLRLSNIFTVIMQGMVTGAADMNLASIKNFTASNLEVNSLNIVCNNIVKGYVWADKDISVDASGVGTLYYRGDAIVGTMLVKTPFTVGKQ